MMQYLQRKSLLCFRFSSQIKVGFVKRFNDMNRKSISPFITEVSIYNARSVGPLV